MSDVQESGQVAIEQNYGYLAPVYAPLLQSKTNDR